MRDHDPSGASEGCLHCGARVPADLSLGGFCCTGCREVYGLLREQGLARYYDLSRGAGAPVAEAPRDRSWAWLEPLVAASESQGPICTLELDVQGVHCAACVWLMGELFRREPGGAGITVNPALGKVRLSWRKGLFDLRRFLGGVERFGYLFGPSRKEADGTARDLLVRIGVCAAIAMNVMTFSAAFYVGLAPADGEVFALFTRLTVWLSAIVVAVGGWPFFRAAWAGLRRGVLHLDLPIAVGLLLAFGTSLWQARGGRGDEAYFDTLNVFVTLMLAGRWLQQRLLDRNRRFLLEDAGAEELWVRRRTSQGLELVAAPAVREGDELWLVPGDLVPVDAELLEEGGAFSLDWITGEPAPRRLSQGQTAPAGSFHAGTRALAVRAKTGFDRSPLPALLRGGEGGRGAAVQHTRFWDRLARLYVLGVFALSAVALALWWPSGPGRALDVTVGLLVVTCPCAIGIAIPLAYELALARLRRRGVFVRGPDLLDRLLRVRKVLFDKTGTLTLGRVRLAAPEALAALPAEHRAAAYDLAARSNHPVSRAIAAELARLGATFDPAARVTEHAGEGLELARSGRVYRLGRPRFAAPDAAASDERAPMLAVDGVPVASFPLRDEVRADAVREVRALTDAGHEVWLISGDAAPRVSALAERLGLPPEQVAAGQRPEDKAALVVSLDRQDTLFVGDGINDSLAFERAFCAGTPAIDRPVMPGKADFFLLGEGLGGIREALAIAHELRAAVRRNLLLALGYNAVAVAACLSGQMTPLRAALVMPLSSLSVLLLTLASLRSERSGTRDARAPAEWTEVAA